MRVRFAGHASDHTAVSWPDAHAASRPYRVPDGGLLAPGPDELWNPTATLVVEIVSPGDETWDKLGFYAAHQVDELLIVDPLGRSVQWLALEAVEYRAAERSGLIDLTPADLAGRIEWPAVG